MAVGTIAPLGKHQFFDNDGDPLASGKLYTYAAGTSTPLATYSDVDLLSANANPIVLDSAGRATIYLSSASYKFVLKTSADSTIWTQDNVSATPPFNVDVDVAGTAGEALSAGNAVYLSTDGLWYRTDADSVLSSILPNAVGMVQAAISSGASGSIRRIGRITGLTSLTPGTVYFASATAGAITATPPTNARLIGVADSSTSIVLASDAQGSTNPRVCEGRLTLETGVPISTSDQTAKTTVYFAPYQGNQIALYSSSVGWRLYPFTQLSIAVPSTTNSLYDVFAYVSSGVPALELSAAWTSDTARFGSGAYASLLPTQDGVEVKSTDGAAIDATRRYLGTFRTTGSSGQTEDSLAKRYLYNRYHQIRRAMRVTEATNSWTYASTTIRQANAATANQLDCVIGAIGATVSVRVLVFASQSAGSAAALGVGIGEDATNAIASGMLGGSRAAFNSSGGEFIELSAELIKYPAIGRHYYAWLEFSNGTSGTYFGDNNAPTITQSGIHGWVEG